MLGSENLYFFSTAGAPTSAAFLPLAVFLAGGATSALASAVARGAFLFDGILVDFQESMEVQLLFECLKCRIRSSWTHLLKSGVGDALFAARTRWTRQSCDHTVVELSGMLTVFLD